MPEMYYRYVLLWTSESNRDRVDLNSPHPVKFCLEYFLLIYKEQHKCTSKPYFVSGTVVHLVSSYLTYKNHCVSGFTLKRMFDSPSCITAHIATVTIVLFPVDQNSWWASSSLPPQCSTLNIPKPSLLLINSISEETESWVGTRDVAMPSLHTRLYTKTISALTKSSFKWQTLPILLVHVHGHFEYPKRRLRTAYVAVSCRNQRLFRHVFQLHCCVWSAISLNFC